MNQQWSVPAGAAVVVLAVLVLAVVALAVALVRARAATRRERESAAAAAATVADLEAQVAAIERRLAAPAAGHRSDAREYVITHVGDEVAGPRHAAAGETPRVEPALFADLVLRESVVRAASLAHGIRVALAPETRNRIRFEVRREVRRSRKDRRAETRLARREYAARRRAGQTDDPSEDAA